MVEYNYMKNMKTKMNVNIPVTIFREDKKFVAYSPVLDLSTSADSFEKVQKRFVEVVEIFFEELIEMGTSDEILTNLGWRRVDKHWNPPVSVANEVTNISIPLSN